MCQHPHRQPADPRHLRRRTKTHINRRRAANEPQHAFPRRAHHRPWQQHRLTSDRAAEIFNLKRRYSGQHNSPAFLRNLQGIWKTGSPCSWKHHLPRRCLRSSWLFRENRFSVPGLFKSLRLFHETNEWRGTVNRIFAKRRLRAGWPLNRRRICIKIRTI
jgi:hypothetical protein